MKLKRYVFLFLLSGAAFFVQVQAQDVKFPNEIKGFELYGRGKLSDIQIGISSSEDVKRIWGKECEGGGCDYDENWKIEFYYFYENWPLYKITGDIQQKFIPSLELVDKVMAITLRPRTEISFKNVVFPSKFEMSSEVAIHSGFDILIYSDPYGLYYTMANDDADSGIHRGNLFYITYRIPTNQIGDNRIILIGEENILYNDPN
jgi:hypothetical protein